MEFITLPIILIAAAALLLIIILATGYIKAPPDMAFIISGLRRKIIIGKASASRSSSAWIN